MQNTKMCRYEDQQHVTYVSCPLMVSRILLGPECRVQPAKLSTTALCSISLGLESFTRRQEKQFYDVQFTLSISVSLVQELLMD